MTGEVPGAVGFGHDLAAGDRGTGFDGTSTHQGPRIDPGDADTARHRRGLLEHSADICAVFARHMKTMEPATDVPIADVLPHPFAEIA